MEIGEEERQRRGGACLVQHLSARTARSDDERTPMKELGSGPNFVAVKLGASATKLGPDPNSFIEARSP
jgi:hypothetical protein